MIDDVVGDPRDSDDGGEGDDGHAGDGDDDPNKKKHRRYKKDDKNWTIVHLSNSNGHLPSIRSFEGIVIL